MIIKGRVQYIMAACIANIDTDQATKNGQNEESICKAE